MEDSQNEVKRNFNKFMLLMTPSSLQGRPDYMEDFFHHEVALRGTPLECSLFAVFDGHRGENTGRFCVENLPRMIVEEIRRSGCPCFPTVTHFLFNAQNNLSPTHSLTRPLSVAHTRTLDFLIYTWPHLESALPCPLLAFDPSPFRLPLRHHTSSHKDRQQEQQEQNEDKEETTASNSSKPDIALASLDMKGIFERVFLDCDQQILESGHEDGSTASVVVIQGRNVWIANLGDSRVILAR
jgi:serine/threonine protein phosphatase PrpC